MADMEALPGSTTWRYLTGVIGVAMLAAGTWAVVRNIANAGVIALVIAGAALLVIPLIVHRLRSLTLGWEGVEIRLTEQIRQLGAPRTAELVAHSDLASLAESYATVREELAEFREARVRVQDALVKRAAALAQRQRFDRTEVSRLLEHGTPTLRVLALGLMEGNPLLADFRSIAEAVGNAGSRNEQYHGLVVAERAWQRLTTAERRQLVGLIDQADVPADSDRARIAERLRRQLLPV